MVKKIEKKFISVVSGKKSLKRLECSAKMIENYKEIASKINGINILHNLAVYGNATEAAKDRIAPFGAKFFTQRTGFKP